IAGCGGDADLVTAPARFSEPDRLAGPDAEAALQMAGQRPGDRNRPVWMASRSMKKTGILTRVIHGYLLRRPILSPGAALLLQPPRRTAVSTPASSSVSRSHGGLRSRTPRYGIHE